LRLMISSTFVDCCTGKSARLFALENPADIDTGPMIRVPDAAAVTHQ
jgi:hypothetical protein